MVALGPSRTQLDMDVSVEEEEEEGGRCAVKRVHCAMGKARRKRRKRERSVMRRSRGDEKKIKRGIG